MAGFACRVAAAMCQVGIKIVANGETPMKYFLDPEEGNFNTFDCTVVVLSCVVASSCRRRRRSTWSWWCGVKNEKLTQGRRRGLARGIEGPARQAGARDVNDC